MKKTTITLSVIAVILMALTTTSWGFSIFGESSKIKKDMEEYLRTTYGKEFVLTEPSLVGGGWGRPATTYVSHAYPADDPEIKFDVSWDTKERTYIDTYLAARWSTEGRKVMEQKLREVYGEGNFFIDKYLSKWNKAEDQKFTWKDVMKNRSEHNRIDFCYEVFFDGALDRKKEAQRAYKILKENFIDYKLMQYNFSVEYVYKNKKKECLDILTDKEKRRNATSATMHKSGILKDWIRVNYTEGAYEKFKGKYPLAAEVKSAEDLLNTRFQIKEGQ
jgi:hypothetical protein